MRLPKTVRIAGVKYKVMVDKKSGGGRVRTGQQDIVVGNEFKHDDRQFATFVHEIAEGSLFERRNAYRSEDGRDIYVMTHKEFEMVTDDIAAALFPMVKK